MLLRTLQNSLALVLVPLYKIKLGCLPHKLGQNHNTKS